jgi:hypothetical protein
MYLHVCTVKWENIILVEESERKTSLGTSMRRQNKVIPALNYLRIMSVWRYNSTILNLGT